MDFRGPNRLDGDLLLNVQGTRVSPPRQRLEDHFAGAADCKHRHRSCDIDLELMSIAHHMSHGLLIEMEELGNVAVDSSYTVRSNPWC